jgi:hypothetical protein
VVQLAVTIESLMPDRAYRWRLRVASDSPYFPHWPWFSMALRQEEEVAVPRRQ